jgi:hypothetical protein
VARLLGRRAAAAVIIGICVLAVPVQPVAAAPTPTNPQVPISVGTIGIQLLDEPAATSGDPRARLYIVDNMAPGAVIHRQIEVSNTTTSVRHASLYATAASIANGAFIGAAGHSANDISSWTSVAPATVDIPAGGTVTATVTITIPTDAAAGERYGAIWAEVSTASTQPAALTQVNRVGIREYISISAGAAPASNFTVDSMTAQRTRAGQLQVVAMVHNTGGRALDMSGILNLSAGPAGLRAGPFPATLGTTLGIGDTEPVTVTVSKQLPAGPWTADIALASGLVQRTAEARLTFPAAGTASAVAISTHSSWLRRFILIGSARLAAGMAGAFIGLRRRRHTVGAAHRRPRKSRRLSHS